MRSYPHLFPVRISVAAGRVAFWPCSPPPFIGEGFRMRPARSEKRERSLGKREKITYHLYSGLPAAPPCVETTKTEYFASCAQAQISGERTSARPTVGTHAHRQNRAPNGCRADRQIGGISRGCAPHRNLAATVLRAPVRSAFCESTAGCASYGSRMRSCGNPIRRGFHRQLPART